MTIPVESSRLLSVRKVAPFHLSGVPPRGVRGGTQRVPLWAKRLGQRKGRSGLPRPTPTPSILKPCGLSLKMRRWLSSTRTSGREITHNAASFSQTVRATKDSRAKGKEKSKCASARLDRVSTWSFFDPLLRRNVYVLFEPLRNEAGQAATARAAEWRPLSERARPLRYNQKPASNLESVVYTDPSRQERNAVILRAFPPIVSGDGRGLSPKRALLKLSLTRARRTEAGRH